MPAKHRRLEVSKPRSARSGGQGGGGQQTPSGRRAGGPGRNTSFREAGPRKRSGRRVSHQGGVFPIKGSSQLSGPDVVVGEVLSPQSVTWHGHLPITCCTVHPAATGSCSAVRRLRGPGPNTAEEGARPSFLRPLEQLKEKLREKTGWLFVCLLPGPCTSEGSGMQRLLAGSERWARVKNVFVQDLATHEPARSKSPVTPPGTVRTGGNNTCSREAGSQRTKQTVQGCAPSKERPGRESGGCGQKRDLTCS